VFGPAVIHSVLIHVVIRECEDELAFVAGVQIDLGSAIDSTATRHVSLDEGFNAVGVIVQPLTVVALDTVVTSLD
jgi:hypothetical protein